MSYSIDPIRGVVVQYNARVVDQTRGGVLDSEDTIKSVEYTFDKNSLLTFADDGGLTVSIPAGAAINYVFLDVYESFTTANATAAGTVNVGLYQKDGTVINATGLIAGATEASLVAGSRTSGAGALVGKRIGAAAGQVKVSSSDAITGGKARLLVSYTIA